MWGLTIVALGVVAYCLISGRLRDSVVTPPMIFAVFGLIVGTAGLDAIDTDVSHSAIHTLAEITLAVVLFSDAARIDLRQLIRDHDIPLRLLAIGMPLTILFGALVAWWLPLGLGLIEAALLAAVLAPTDAALGQSVVSNKAVPTRIRQALNVESGLNDGIAVPFVFLFAALMATASSASATQDLTVFTAKQLLLGPLVGIAVGAAAGWLALAANARGWMDDVFEGPLVLATIAVAFALADVLGGNSFISVFVAGVCFGRLLDGQCKFILEFAESEGQMLVLIAFLTFGAVLLPELAGAITWPMVVYAVLSLTLIRMLPAALSLLGVGLSLPSLAFLGWFGPRGLASILFALLVVEQLHSEAAKTILIVATLTIALSIVAHGVSAAPLAARYARLAQDQGDCPENMPVSEMPTRHNN